MKTPCEIVVRYVLPYIRREIIKELAENHRLTQAEIARRFDVTDAAISMYMRSKKGSFNIIESSSIGKDFKTEIRESAQKIAYGKDVNDEACRLCRIFKKSTAFVRIYESNIGEPMPACKCQMCCSKPEYSVPTSAMLFDESRRLDQT
jgi:predicted transcriptional regulator